MMTMIFQTEKAARTRAAGVADDRGEPAWVWRTASGLWHVSAEKPTGAAGKAVQMVDPKPTMGEM
jgi:hypothetical protein